MMALLVVERRHWRELHRRTLFRRWLVWLAIAPIYTLSVLAGQLTALLLVSLLVFQGLREYARLVSLDPVYRAVLLAMGLIAGPVAVLSFEFFLALPPVLLVIATLQPLLLQNVRTGVRQLAFAALGWGYLPLLLDHFLLMHQYVPGGPGILLTLGLAAALSDIAAFTVGNLLGSHKLAPALSPNKTWEGVLGNLLGAYLGVFLMGFAVPADLQALLLLTLPIVVAIGAVWGDLLESLIKREFQVKDAGTWLPGFGGLLDRIDSLIIVIPLVYYYLRLIG